MRNRRDFLKHSAISASAFFLSQTGALASCGQTTNQKKEAEDSPYFKVRGLNIGWDSKKMLDWPTLAHEAGVNMLAVTVSGTVSGSDPWKKFLADCRKYDIQVENHQHALSWLLPRNLFEEDPSMFRMDENGKRTPDFNCCPSSEKALDIIATNALKNAKDYPSTTGRYFFWQHDDGKMCNCPADKELSASDQLLIVENAIIRKLREDNSSNTLAHLAYYDTIPAPSKIKPEEGIFLQYAPFERTWDYPISDPNAKKAGKDIINIEYLHHLDENLKLFPAETAEILEYWLDVSMFSSWTQPAVKLPWKKEIFLSDIASYAKRGIRDIVTYVIYVDQDYMKMYKDIGFIDEYGQELKNYRV